MVNNASAQDQMYNFSLTQKSNIQPYALPHKPLILILFFYMKIHLDGMVDAAMDLSMVTTTTAQMEALEGEDPLATIEVGGAPTVVTGVEARLISLCRMQVS